MYTGAPSPGGIGGLPGGATFGAGMEVLSVPSPGVGAGACGAGLLGEGAGAGSEAVGVGLGSVTTGS